MGVAIALHFRAQEAHEFFLSSRMLRLLSQVDQFLRVRLEVEELRAIDEGVADELPPSVTDRPHAVAISKISAFADGRFLAAHDGE